MDQTQLPNFTMMSMICESVPDSKTELLNRVDLFKKLVLTTAVGVGVWSGVWYGNEMTSIICDVIVRVLEFRRHGIYGTVHAILAMT